MPDYPNIEILPSFVNENGVLWSGKYSITYTVLGERINKVGVLALQAMEFVTFEAMWIVQVASIAV